MKFYSSVRLDIRRVSSIKDGDEVIGNLVRVKVVKNKVAPPFRKCEFEITFGEGVSKVGEIVDLGVEYGIIQKSGSWFSYESNRLAQGRDAVKKLLQDNPELCEELDRQADQGVTPLSNYLTALEQLSAARLDCELYSILKLQQQLLRKRYISEP